MGVGPTPGSMDPSADYPPWGYGSYGGGPMPLPGHMGNQRYLGLPRSRRESLKNNGGGLDLTEYLKSGGRVNVAQAPKPKLPQTTTPSPNSQSVAQQNQGEQTTVMLRNIPNRYTQSMLLEVLIEQGFRGLYDFVYLPMDFRNGVNLGYAFVNLLTNEDALHFMCVFQGFSKWFVDSVKVCEVSWAHPHQGRQEHVERYRNSPVMHPSMPEEYKPMIFRKGMRVPFPPPTKVVHAPKLRPIRDRAQGGQMSGSGNNPMEMPVEYVPGPVTVNMASDDTWSERQGIHMQPQIVVPSSTWGSV